MIVFYCILSAIIGALLAVIIMEIVEKHKGPKCDHKWIQVQEYAAYKTDMFTGDKYISGFCKTYECQHCKKSKRSYV